MEKKMENEMETGKVRLKWQVTATGIVIIIETHLTPI